MDRRTLKYRRALLPAFVLALLGLTAINPFAVVAWLSLAALFVWGLAAGSAYIFVFNRIETGRHQRLFVKFSYAALPFVVFGALIGGLAGPFGIVVNSSIPLAALLLFAGWALHKAEGVRTRSIIAAALFAVCIAGAAAWYVAAQWEHRAKNCAEAALGAWDAQERLCVVAAEQALRNAIFFSVVLLDSENMHISFTDDFIDERTPHSKPGDLIADVYVQGAASGTARYQADLAMNVNGFVVVPVVVEATGKLYLFSLQHREGSADSSIKGTELAGFAALEGTEAASARREGTAIRLAVRQPSGVADVSFRVADDGGFMKLSG